MPIHHRRIALMALFTVTFWVYTLFPADAAQSATPFGFTIGAFSYETP